MRKKKIMGLFFILISTIIVASNFRITGAITGSPFSDSLSLVAVVFFILGLILVSYRDRNYAREILEKR